MIALRALLLGLLLASTAAFAQTSRNGHIIIEGAWARLAPGGDKTLSIFFDILNTGDEPDALISATSPAATKVALRQGKWDGLDFENKKSPEITTKASKRTSLRPGVMEVTLGGLTAPASVGDTIPVTLIFRNAGEITIAPVISNQMLGNRGRK